jgi:lipopolysaccharide transport system ATP-binding protein
MIDLAFENVSKKYIIRHSVETDSRYKSRLGRIFASQGRQEFWAVRDLSFHVKRGETLGIIGPNGAGKSTILKLLSRITAPTAGRVTINGKLSALIEVGSGFHPDLTGRENVYLSGSILGMRRSEITKKFDNIVEFAGLKNFIDTPVKRYSSGMYVRLGFAIAAQLEQIFFFWTKFWPWGTQALRSSAWIAFVSLKTPAPQSFSFLMISTLLKGYAIEYYLSITVRCWQKVIRPK